MKPCGSDNSKQLARTRASRSMEQNTHSQIITSNAETKWPGATTAQGHGLEGSNPRVQTVALPPARYVAECEMNGNDERTALGDMKAFRAEAGKANA